jgi:hypothetical protein
MRKSWEIQPGKGASILEGLGKDVRLRARLGPPTEEQHAEIVEAQQAAEDIIDRGIHTLFAGETSITRNQLLGRLMVAEHRSLASARIGDTLYWQLVQFENRSYLEADQTELLPHIKIGITPLVPDAVFWDVCSGWPRTRERETRMLRVDEAREGRFTKYNSLLSAPAVGGKLTMSSGGSFIDPNHVTITGLVSPVTGEPQVDLEVFAKTG